MHILAKHRSEPGLVAMLRSLDRSPDALAILQNLGDFWHNVGTLVHRCGVFLVATPLDAARAGGDAGNAVPVAEEYFPCVFCLAFFSCAAESGGSSHLDFCSSRPCLSSEARLGGVQLLAAGRMLMHGAGVGLVGADGADFIRLVLHPLSTDEAESGLSHDDELLELLLQALYVEKLARATTLTTGEFPRDSLSATAEEDAVGKFWHQQSRGYDPARTFYEMC